MAAVLETNITEYPLISKGKVRDIYEIDDETYCGNHGPYFCIRRGHA